MKANTSILLIFAHPDDESFGVAGTVAKYGEQGVPVDLICATRGEKGTRSGVPANLETGKAREAELRLAAAIVGVHNIFFLDYVDEELSQVDREEITSRILRIAGQVQPEVVITFGPDGITGHPDHVAIGKAATAAFNKLRKEHSWPRKLYYVTIPESAVSNREELGVATRPDSQVTTAIDIHQYLELKIKAIAVHKSQQDAQDYIEMLQNRELASFTDYEFFYLANSKTNEKETDLFQQ